MKLKYPVATCVLLIGLTGCSRNEQANNENKPDSPTTAKEVKERFKDAAAATSDFVAENKDEFIASMDKKLKEWDARIAELAQKSEGYKDDAKAQTDKAMSSLREQREKAKAKFEAVKVAGADAWKDVKEGFASAMEELQQAYENAKSKFN